MPAGVSFTNAGSVKLRVTKNCFFDFQAIGALAKETTYPPVDARDGRLSAGICCRVQIVVASRVKTAKDDAELLRPFVLFDRELVCR